MDFDEERYFPNVREVTRRLDEEYEPTDLGNREDPFEELVYVLLSNQTREEFYQPAFERVKEVVGDWDDLPEVKTETLAAAIGSAGLATQKAQRLKATADQIRERAGEVSLDFLHEMDTDAADLYLRGLRGVGVKTARCILMYSLGRSVFPLDTHCGRIIARLGWLAHAPQDPSLSEAQKIEAAIPEDLRRTLHIRGVQHGRAICLARGPECSACVVRSFCDFYRENRHAEGEIHE